MNTLLDLMHQVWHRRTPARPSFAVSAAVTPRRSGVAEGDAPSVETRSDLWMWYQSRCTETEQEIPRR